MNVLQVLATTSIGFALFATVWVLYVEEWLEQREVEQTGRTRHNRDERDEPVERTSQTDGGD
jgi:hypothetical protein